MKRTILIVSTLLFLNLTWLGTAEAEQSRKFDNYIVHYSTLPTTFLTAKVAADYNIKRSRNRAMINIAIKQGSKSAIAAVSTTAVNLSKQLKTIFMRPVHDGDVVYYIGEFPVSNEETLDFTVKITPANTNKTYELNFREKFYTE